MIELSQFHPAIGLPNGSAFCMKVEALLRLLGLPYSNNYVDKPGKPYGKLPVIRIDGELIADSRLIKTRLLSIADTDPDAALFAADRAHAHALARMLEEHFYFIAMHERWLDEKMWEKMKSVYFGGMPPVLASLVPAMVRKKIARDLQGQGTGRLPLDVRRTLAAEDVKALAQSLGDKPYFFGDKPVTFDATAFAFLASICHATVSSMLKDVVAESPTLVAYCDRMKDQLWPEGYPASGE